MQSFCSENNRVWRVAEGGETVLVVPIQSGIIMIIISCYYNIYIVFTVLYNYINKGQPAFRITKPFWKYIIHHVHHQFASCWQH